MQFEIRLCGWLNSLILGLAGFFPIHPRSYMTAWRNRRNTEQAEKSASESVSEDSNENAK